MCRIYRDIYQIDEIPQYNTLAVSAFNYVYTPNNTMAVLRYWYVELKITQWHFKIKQLIYKYKRCCFQKVYHLGIMFLKMRVHASVMLKIDINQHFVVNFVSYVWRYLRNRRNSTK